MNSLTEKLRPHVQDLMSASSQGDKKAQSVISLYQMYVSCPSDPGAPALCSVAFDEWLAEQETEK